MAEAMIAGIVQSNEIPLDQIIVTNRSNQERLEELNQNYGIKALPLKDVNFNEIDVVILAMKPKDVQKAVDSLELTNNQLVLSVLAGVTTSFLEGAFKNDHPIIRVMPNTSSMMQESATAISTGQFVSVEQVRLAKALLQCMGEVFLIDEDKMDIFTGIAGSGPAYYYYLMEHIEKVGAKEGLSRELARKIGAQTILGAAKMILEQEETPAELRENVTSPNGTTQAGLDALRENGGGEAIYKAVESASKRSKEISEQLQQQLVMS
ncbi:pyrroline-5-carboxylate reductase [Bacillus coahuilensis p1.1.43]|uniref:Pyrroline-5-carboxylate reductase n=2 Tax=Bacillus coahuilensis TaxID=408580 RepID=A0A147K986_9BACI|nr:pyrroline-5-carboxylate reductase [Bacillus coahuilensis p1.1.43]